MKMSNDSTELELIMRKALLDNDKNSFLLKLVTLAIIFLILLSMENHAKLLLNVTVTFITT